MNSDYQTSPDTIYYYQPTRDVNFRKEHSSNSEILSVLSKKDTLILLDSVNNWFKIQDQSNNIGYVSKRYIEKHQLIHEPKIIEQKNVFSENYNITLIGIFSSILIITILVLLNRLKSKTDQILINEKEIKLKDSKIESQNSQLKKLEPIISLENEITNLESKKKNLTEEYKEGKNLYNKLKNEISIFNQNFDFIENGVYEPIFDFNTSEEFKTNILLNKSSQKELIKIKNACICHTEWTVSGSKREGSKMTNRTIRLTLRAFNGECDSLISKVRWNNIKNLEQRILKSHEMINKLNETQQVEITNQYLNLKIIELQLNHEYNLKKHEEKEELKAARTLIREEEKAKRDFERAQKEAEKEQKLYEKALSELRNNLGLVSGEELSKLQNKIYGLESDLELSRQKSERALSMAQQTKRGHVYVVSNLGSFGKDIYKIGMTRRLDPYDRVKELGDASVPFVFDMHAMIFTEDAPKLESLLHQKFNDKRVNKVNFRKEYFNVTIEEIEECIASNFKGVFEIFKDIEAKDFNQSLQIAKVKSQSKDVSEKEDNEFPDTLF